jgi:hypothetical protein
VGNKIQIRFNTEHGLSNLYWRVIVDDKEFLAKSVQLEVSSFSTTDTLADGRIKHHITAIYNELIWNEDSLVVK